MATVEAKMTTSTSKPAASVNVTTSTPKKAAVSTTTTTTTSKTTSVTTSKPTTSSKAATSSSSTKSSALKKGENPAEFLPSATDVDALVGKYSQLTRDEVIAHAYDFNKTAKKSGGAIKNSKFLKFLGIKDSFLKLLPNAVDLNHDKKIDMREYMKFVSQVKKSSDRELFELLFRMFDKNNDDRITKSEFKNGFKKMRKAGYLSKEAEGHLINHVLNNKLKKDTIFSRAQFVDACMDLVPKETQPTTSGATIASTTPR